MSQREMARRLGFHESVYGKSERGDRVIDVIEFVSFAEAVGVSPSQLLERFVELSKAEK